jgi:uncharacterized protein (DUF488 family)
MSNAIFTIGHSNHSFEHFLKLLQQNQITAIADVRSQPYSKFNPQFNRELLCSSLKKNQIEYVFLGDELGARSKDKTCYAENRVQYDRLANTHLFQNGLHRLLKGFQSYKIALLCSEKEPTACHRTILVARHLIERGLEVRHILANGSTESHNDVMNRLIGQLKLPSEDLFHSRHEIVLEAYRQQAHIIAYVEPSKLNKAPHKEIAS